MIAKTPRHLRVFLSSPGDLEAERDAGDRVLEDLPRVYAWKGKFTIGPVRWDDPHAPAPMDAHLIPQDAVIRGLSKPSECDIVVVILWGRIGTPLPGSYKKPNGDSYVSGTEWEYEDAQQAGKHLLLYRCTEKPRLDVDDSDFEEKRRQYRLVGEFFKRFEAPIFTRTFDLLSWLLPATHHFPRAHRHSATQRLLDAAFDLRERLEEANLRRGAARLERLRTRRRGAGARAALFAAGGALGLALRGPVPPRLGDAGRGGKAARWVAQDRAFLKESGPGAA